MWLWREVSTDIAKQASVWRLTFRPPNAVDRSEILGVGPTPVGLVGGKGSGRMDGGKIQTLRCACEFLTVSGN